nr:MAG TPA: hypothetical protein [Bacteriophage sp.]
MIFARAYLLESLGVRLGVCARARVHYKGEMVEFGRIVTRK